MARSGQVRWRRVLRLGCLGIAGVVVLLVVVAAGIAVVQIRSTRIESRALSQRVGPDDGVPAPDAPTGAAPLLWSAGRSRILTQRSCSFGGDESDIGLWS